MPRRPNRSGLRSTLAPLATTLLLTPLFSAVSLMSTPLTANAADPITLSVDDSRISWPSDYPRNAEYKDIQLAPFDGAGHLMLYLPVTRPVDAQHLPLLMRWSTGDGRFNDATPSALPFVDASSARDTYDADFVDVDGDGDYDIVHSSPHGNFIYINNGNVFTDETVQRLPAFARTDLQDVWDDVVAGDVDSDGDLDLIFANRTFDLGDRPAFPDPSNWGPTILLYNDGNGFFNRAPGNDISANWELFGVDSGPDFPGEMENSSHATKLGDLNNDGRIDMVIGHIRNYLSRPSPSAPAIDIYINQGTNAEGKVQWSKSTSNGPEYQANLALLDFDNDGNLDLYSARGSEDRLLLGNGNGTFGSPMLVNTLAGGLPSTGGELPLSNGSYDVVVGDLNDDGWQDIVAPGGDGRFWRHNKIFLNDSSGGTPALQRSNDAVINPLCNDTDVDGDNVTFCTDWDARPFQVSAAIADVNRDGRLDLIWGSDGRTSGTPDEWPTVTMNTTSGLSDDNPPVMEPPALFLSSNDAPAAVFSVRIRDRVQDIDEITANMQWRAQGNAGSSNIGSAALEWSAVDTYQARLLCKDLRAGYGPNEDITNFDWEVLATDAAGLSVSMEEDDPLALNLLPRLSDGSGTALGLSIKEPLEGSGRLVPNDGTGRLLVRVEMQPLNMLPDASQFRVTIDGQTAEVITGERVGNEFWLAVEAPAGPVGAHAVAVSMRICDYTTPAVVENNAVFYDDDVRLSDTVLVVDASGSMKDDRKIESAINAARLYANVMRDPEHVGVVEYSGESGTLADDIFGPAVAGDTPAGGPPPVDNRSAAADAAATITPAGCTPLGAGLLEGLAVLNAIGANANDRRSLILLSDGMENVPPYWASPPDEKCGGADAGTPVIDTFNALKNDGNPATSVRIHTVSLGPDARPELMNAISTFTDGEDLTVDVFPSPENTSFNVTPMEVLANALVPTALAQQGGPAQVSLENRLANVYEHQHNAASYQQRLWETIHITKGGSTVPSSADTPMAGVAANAIAVRAIDPTTGQQRAVRGDRVEVPVEPGLDYAAIAVNWPDGPGQVGTALPPLGQDLAKVKVVQGPSNTVLQIDEPAPGTWVLGLPHPQGTEVMITVSGLSSEVGFVRSVTAESTITTGNASFQVPATPEPGEPVPVHLVLVGETPVTGATVTAQAVGPGGQGQAFTLVDDGSGTDVRANDAIYSGMLTQTPLGGAFNVQVAASWTGADGVARSRVFPHTVVVEERDTDRDGISDLDERRYGLNPNDPNDAWIDADDDGLVNWREVALGLDPFNPDSDGGGAKDGDELTGATDPEFPNDDGEVGKDTDGDGMTDACERRWGFDPDNPFDGEQDPDHDGLTNAQECEFRTSPVDADTDDDYTPDGEEVENGTDPIDPVDRQPPEITPEPGEGEDAETDQANGLVLWLLCLLLFIALLTLLLVWRHARNSGSGSP